MALQGLAQAVQDGQALLLRGRDIAADGEELLGGRPAAEGAGDLLLGLDRAQIALGLLVAVWHPEVAGLSPARST